ncbi:MAG: VWA domain-containing protein [Vicinamibacteraceae bacterium]
MSTRRRVRLALMLAGAAAALLPLSAQQTTQQPPPGTPVLRASVDQVIVDVVVTDEHGGVVPALTADDFDVYERGQRQTVGTFSEVSLPLVRPLKANAPVAASDVRTNQRRPEGRIYVLVLDDHHIGVGRTGTVQNAAREFLNRQVQAGDLVAVVTTTGVGGAFQDFTEDAALASAAIDRFVGRQPGETAALQRTAEDAFMARAAQTQSQQAQAQAAAQVGADLSVSQSAATQAESAFGARNADPMAVRRNSTAIIADGAITDNDDAAVEAQERARITLRTLRTVADGLGGIPGRRKAILYFSEGLPVTPRAADLVDEMSRVTAAAARANVTLYAFDPRGLDLHMGAELLATGVSPSAQLQQKRRLSADMLRSLAEETGGAAAIDSNDMGKALTRVASESSHYYLIGYAPIDGAHDGRYRSIDVRVKRPGLRVSARKGYLAPDDKAPPPASFSGLGPELSELVRRPMSTLGLPLAVMAVPLPIEFDNVTVTVEVGAQALGFDERDGRHENTVDLAIVPVGTGGKVYPLVNGHARLSLPPADAEAVRTLGLRMVERLTLPAGTYQLHIAAREVRHGAAGSVICDLVVPDRMAPGLSMTPLIVSGTRARRVPSANRDDQVLRALGGSPPTTSRVFQRDETISAYAEVVDVGAAIRRDVELVTIVRDARERDVVHSVRPNASDRAEPGKSFPYAIDIPLRTLPPGRYLLRVEARAAGTPEPVVREVRFEVTAG